MARPRKDPQIIRDTIIKIAEGLLAESGGRRLVLSELAQRMGVSQSYVYRHFTSKDALVGELAQRWFVKVETQGKKICASGLTWQEKLREYILKTLEIKRASYNANPELFMAYLVMAGAHEEIVKQHTSTLAEQLREILSQSVPKSQLNTILNLVLDATYQFRVPSAIAHSPSASTKKRANAVLDVLIASIEKHPKKTLS